MGRTWKIRARGKKRKGLAKRKDCLICKKKLPASNPHHHMCNKCWKKYHKEDLK